MTKYMDSGGLSHFMGLVKADIPFIEQNNATASDTFTADAPFTSLKDGQRIFFWRKYNWQSSGYTNTTNYWSQNGCALNLTLSDGTTTGAIPIFYNSTSRLTSHYQGQTCIMMIYRENVVAPGYADTHKVAQAWYCVADYNSDNVYSRSIANGFYCGANGILSYGLCMKDANGRWTAIVNNKYSNSTQDKTCYTGGLELGEVLYAATWYSNGRIVGDNQSISGDFYASNIFDFRFCTNINANSAAGKALTVRQPVYLVGTVNASNGLYYLDTTQWWTQTPNETGKVYIYLGVAYSWYQLCLVDRKDAYIYSGGKLVEYDNSRIRAAESKLSGIESGAQVNTITGVKGNAEGSYRTGQVNLTYANLGTAPIANGGTGATTADAARANLAVVGKADEMLTTNPFAPASLKGPYISKIDNAFYAADKRWTITKTGTTTGNGISCLFDGDYESRMQVPKSSSVVISMDFTSTTYFPGYPYGYILVSFYYNEVPASVSGRVYCNYQSHGIGWHDITFSPVADNQSTACVYRSAHQGYYNISQLEITVSAGSSTVAGITQVEMHLDRPNSGRNPFLSKYAAETLYYNLTAPKFIGALEGDVAGNCSGTASNVTGTVAVANGGTGKTTGNAAANYFLNELGTGSSDPVDADYYISQYVNGGTTTTTYHRRPMSALWNYIKSKISSVLGLTVSNYGGTAAKATKLETARAIQTNLASTSSANFDGSSNVTPGITGTLAIANGGTGATTAANARANLGLSSIGYYDGYIRTQPENSPVIIPFINNDIAFLLKRGGSAVVKYDGVVQNVDISNAFDGSPSYWGITYTGTNEIVIELTLHKVFSWTNRLYLDFGPWYTKTIKVEVMYSGTGYPNDVWTTKLNTTTNTLGFVSVDVSHTPVGASNAGGGFNKVRLTFSFANGAYSTTMFRIAQIGILNYGSYGLRETYMSRGIDDPVYRNITPATTGTYNLGSTTLKWSNFYANNIYASKIVDTVQFGSNSQSAISNAGIKVNDVRNASLTNNMLDNAANFYFTNSGTPNNNWWSLLHVKGWTGAYSAWELAGPAHNADMRTTPLYVRTGNASNTWGSWRKIFDDAQTVPVANGGTGATSAANARTNLGVPPTSHAASATTYGAGSSSNYGHVKLSDATNSSTDTTGGTAATPKAVKAAYDLANQANGTANSALSSATGGLVFKITYSISSGNVVCAAHVYSAGSEVTSSHADSCFVWSMSLNGGTSWTSLGTGKTKTVSAMTTYGGNVKCDFTPAS